MPNRASFFLTLLASLSLGGCQAEENLDDAGAGDAGSSDGGSVDAGVDAGPPHRLIFVSSTGHDADFGGIAGADAYCAMLASNGGLPGTFKAWLSTTSEPVAGRLTHSSDPYLRVDGVKVADDWADLTDGTLDAAINVTELGTTVGGDAWTGTETDGTSWMSGDCGGFDDATMGNSLCGQTSSSSSTWTQYILPSCAAALRLYCVED